MVPLDFIWSNQRNVTKKLIEYHAHPTLYLNRCRLIWFHSEKLLKSEILLKLMLLFSEDG